MAVLQVTLYQQIIKNTAMESKIEFVRNATLILNYAGKRLLMDPMFADKGAYPGFPGTINSELSNPLVGMPVEPESLLNVDAVLVSHLHPDHWDEVAVQTLPKDLKILAQSKQDAQAIESQGFTEVEVLAENTDFEGLQIKKTYCQHGTNTAYSVKEIEDFLGYPSGFYFNAEGEKSVYFLGDTLLIDEVEQNLKTWRPDMVVVNAGSARFADEQLGPVTMGKEDVEKIHNLLPEAVIVAIHMEALNHCVLGRNELQAYVEEKGFTEKVIIPNDGEVIDL